MQWLMCHKTKPECCTCTLYEKCYTWISLYIYIYIYIYIMKIIPTWPQVSLPRFHKMAPAGAILKSHLVILACGYRGIIFIIFSHILSTLLYFSLGNSVGVFSFDLTYILLDNFQVARVFHLFYFYKFLFLDINL